ncbi:MAG TPA: hypothetical protein VEX41_02660, partial [Candidatus Eisenbacteria bacterium]|nr:hypothetical protein [Candidatus Eisenbacteria bacterium]
HTNGWPNGYQGCPSIGFQGNMAVIFEGSVHTNSACTASSNPPGAIGINGGGSSVSISLVSPAVIQMVGTWSPGPLQITPAPITNAQPIEDPLNDLPVMPTLATSTTAGNPRTTIGNGLNPECAILEPGTYPGGIDIKAQGSAWLRPGMYVIAGGGITLGAQGAIYSLSGDTNITNCNALDQASWDTALCKANECGVLIYNTSGTGGAFSAMGPLDLGGGAGVKLRAYVPSIDPMSTRQTAYKNLMFWQDVNPVPDQNYRQPELNLRGGGTAFLQGTVYAPSARVNLGGNCGGAGGEPLDLTLQFISWDLFISGSCTFNFLYNVEGFTDFPVYGLIR